MSEPVRILQVIGLMDRGGAETMIMNLYRNIDREKVQFDFVVHTTKNAAYDEEIRKLGGRIYRCPRYQLMNHIQYVRWWNRFFHDHQYKIVHGHIGSSAAIYLWIAKKYNAFTIAHSHSSGKPISFKGYVYNLLSYPTRYIADYFFGCSITAGIDRYGKKIANSDRFSMLKNALNPETFTYCPETDARIREKLSIPQDSFVVGHVGRFTAEKNHRFVLEILKELIHLNQNTVGILVGDGPMRSEMIQYAKDLGIDGNVMFTGVRGDVDHLLQAMDYLVFPSLFEGLPLTLVEAQSTGLKCIISDRVPLESIIVKDLVLVESLDKKADEWAKIIYDSIPYERKARPDEIKMAGYDISDSSVKLQQFYIKHSA